MPANSSPPRAVAALALLLTLPAAAALAAVAHETRQREPVIGGPCEGCEAVFVGLPETIASTTRIASESEPGEPMVLEGTVYDRDGRVAPGVIVYAYQTDAGGIYPAVERLRGTDAYRHGRLRGWARSDESGRYRFETIRPGSYPSRDNPEHIHMHVLEVGCCTYYLTSVRFTDDPLLSAADRREATQGRGGNSLATPRRNADGVWIAERDIHLGRGVPGYPGGEGAAP